MYFRKTEKYLLNGVVTLLWIPESVSHFILFLLLTLAIWELLHIRGKAFNVSRGMCFLF